MVARCQCTSSATTAPSFKPAAAQLRLAAQPACVVRRMAAPATCAAGARPDIKLIATDVDGTLLNSKQELTERTEKSVRAAAELGIPVVVATGKPRGPWAASILPRMGQPVPGVFMQGLVITDGEGKTLYSRDLNRGIAVEGIEIARRLGLTFAAYCGDRVLSEVINQHTDRLIFYGEPTPELTEGIENIVGSTLPLQKYILLEEPDRMQEVRPEIEVLLGDRASITTALPGMLEVLPKGASKGDGLRRLLEMMDIDPQNVMMMGDGENDVEAFRMVGLAVAMGNAVAEARAAADKVVATNNEDGVAQAIERFVLEPMGALAT